MTRLADMSADALASYRKRLERRRKLRFVIGRRTRLSSMSTATRRRAEASVELPTKLPRSLALPAELPVIVFDCRYSEELLSGDKSSTVRRRSSRLPHFLRGQMIDIQCPRGQSLARARVTDIELDPELSASHLKALAGFYRGRPGPWVKISFELDEE